MPRQLGPEVRQNRWAPWGWGVPLSGNVPVASPGPTVQVPLLHELAPLGVLRSLAGAGRSLTAPLALRSAGVGRTGVFITLSIVLERMRYEGVVDMFQTVKTLRTQRPAMVQTEVSDPSSPGWWEICGRREGSQHLRTLNPAARCPWVAASHTSSLVALQDQYQLCYRAALEYLGSFDHYAT